MSRVAFALKAGFDHDSVGAVFIDNQRDFNVRQSLQDADDVIVTDDPAVISVLDAYEPLKRVSVPDATDSQRDDAREQTEAALADHTVAELRDIAERAGLDAPAGARKDQLVTLIADNQATSELTGA